MGRRKVQGLRLGVLPAIFEGLELLKGLKLFFCKGLGFKVDLWDEWEKCELLSDVLHGSGLRQNLNMASFSGFRPLRQ